MNQRNTIVIGVMLGAFTTGIYSWYTRPGSSGEALANTPLTAPGKATGAFDSLAPPPLPDAPAASPAPVETPGVTPDLPADSPPERAATPPAERVAAPGERPGSPVRNYGRGKSKRDD
jgi:hypothetical protein